MQKFQNLISLIESQQRGSSAGHSPVSKMSIQRDEQFLKASLKAHDSRKFLLQGSQKSVQDRLNSLARKKSSPSTRMRLKQSSMHENSYMSTGEEMTQIILPINEIPMPKQYKRLKTETTNEAMDQQLTKYPKLQNYFQIKRKKTSESEINQTSQNLSRPSIDDSRFQLKYGVKFDNIITKFKDKDAKIRIQKIYDRYTFQKISTKLYTEIPDVSRYTRLVSTQTQIVKDIVQNHRLSRSNQKKLEQNLKDIYRQILKN